LQEERIPSCFFNFHSNIIIPSTSILSSVLSPLVSPTAVVKPLKPEEEEKEEEEEEEEGEKRKGVARERLHFNGGGQKKFSGFEDSQALPARPSGKGTFEGG
jgi:hypothetical protein